MGMGGPGVWDATEGYKRQGVVEVVGRHCHCAGDDCGESVALRVVDAYFYFEARRFSVGGAVRSLLRSRLGFLSFNTEASGAVLLTQH